MELQIKQARLQKPEAEKLAKTLTVRLNAVHVEKLESTIADIAKKNTTYSKGDIIRMLIEAL